MITLLNLLKMRLNSTCGYANNEFSSFSVDESGELRSGSERSGDTDSVRMPPPKFPSSAHSSIKKRKSKRSLDYGSGNFGSSASSLGTARSAPVTPTSDRSSSKV